MDYLILILLVIASYFLGNISIARIISKSKNFDITKVGSGNPGATNMLRKYGFKIGILTLFLDAVKGIIPALAGFLIFGGASGGLEARIALYACGDAVILGHIWPVLYKFKGGKGISTTLGVFAVADPLIMLIVFAGAFLYVLFFEYMSVASLLITTILTIIEVTKIPADADPTLSLILRILVFLIFAVTWFAHRGNIHRLLVGKENKANLKRSLKKLKKEDKEQQKLEEKLQKQEEKVNYKLENKNIQNEENNIIIINNNANIKNNNEQNVNKANKNSSIMEEKNTKTINPILKTKINKKIKLIKFTYNLKIKK